MDKDELGKVAKDIQDKLLHDFKDKLFTRDTLEELRVKVSDILYTNSTINSQWIKVKAIKNPKNTDSIELKPLNFYTYLILLGVEPYKINHIWPDNTVKYYEDDTMICSWLNKGGEYAGYTQIKKGIKSVSITLNLPEKPIDAGDSLESMTKRYNESKSDNRITWYIAWMLSTIVGALGYLTLHHYNILP